MCDGEMVLQWVNSNTQHHWCLILMGMVAPVINPRTRCLGRCLAICFLSRSSRKKVRTSLNERQSIHFSLQAKDCGMKSVCGPPKNNADAYQIFNNIRRWRTGEMHQKVKVSHWKNRKRTTTLLSIDPLREEALFDIDELADDEGLSLPSHVVLLSEILFIPFSAFMTLSIISLMQGITAGLFFFLVVFIENYIYKQEPERFILISTWILCFHISKHFSC